MNMVTGVGSGMKQNFGECRKDLRRDVVINNDSCRGLLAVRWRNICQLLPEHPMLQILSLLEDMIVITSRFEFPLSLNLHGSRPSSHRLDPYGNCWMGPVYLERKYSGMTPCPSPSSDAQDYVCEETSVPFVDLDSVE